MLKPLPIKTNTNDKNKKNHIFACNNAILSNGNNSLWKPYTRYGRKWASHVISRFSEKYPYNLYLYFVVHVFKWILARSSNKQCLATFIVICLPCPGPQANQEEKKDVCIRVFWFTRSLSGLRVGNHR